MHNHNKYNIYISIKQISKVILLESQANYQRKQERLYLQL